MGGTTTEVEQIADIIDSATGDIFTESDWCYWIKEKHMEHIKEVPTAAFIRKNAKRIHALAKQVPADIIAAAAPVVYTPKRGDTVALINKQDCSLRYAQRLGPADAKKYSLEMGRRDVHATRHRGRDRCRR